MSCTGILCTGVYLFHIHICKAYTLCYYTAGIPVAATDLPALSFFALLLGASNRQCLSFSDILASELGLVLSLGV
jgi:hypothetical protein